MRAPTPESDDDCQAAAAPAHPASRTARRLGLDLSPRTHVFGAFFLYAFSMGGFFPRLAEIQRALGVAEGPFGLALIGTATGTLVSLTFASRILERVGYRIILVLIPLLALLYALACSATDAGVLFLALIAPGLCIGAIEVIVNLEADRVEHLGGRLIMNRAHAFWSLGFFASGTVGALMSQAGISPRAHLFMMVPVVLAGTVLVLGRFDPAPRRAGGSAQASPAFARPTLGILVLVALTLSAMVMEGAGADWSAIYMRDVFGSSHFVAGFAVAAGALAQGITRYFADGLVQRYRPAPVARAFLTVLGVGAILVFAAPASAIALLGFGLMGVGTSVIFPLAMSAAAQRTDRPAAINVAALAQTSFVAFLLGPPLLGFVAEHMGIRWTFGIALPLVAISFAAARSLSR